MSSTSPLSEHSVSPYRAIFANAIDGIAIIDRNAGYIEQNLAHRVMLGYSHEELVGQTPALLVGEEVFRRVAKELTDTGRFNGEVRARRKDGCWIDIALSAFGIYDDNGDVLFYVGMTQDITRRKQAEMALRDSETRFVAIFDQMTSGIAQTDLAGRFMLMNDRYCEITGRSREALLGLRMQDITHPEDLPANLEKFQALAEGRGRAFSVEKRYVKPDGSVVWVHNEVSAIRDITGRIRCINAVATDITESKKTEHFIRRITDVAPSILYVYDLEERRNVWGNKEMFAWLGYRREDIDAMAGDLLRSLVHPDDWPRYLNHVDTLTRLGDGDVAEFEYRMRHADGSYRWLHSRDTVFERSGNGMVKQIAGSALDITDRKLAEDAMLAAHDTFRHLVEQSPFGVYAVDSDFRLVQVSAGAQKVFQNVRPLLGRDFSDVLRQIWPEPFAGEAIGRFRHTLETGEPYRSPPIVERRQDIDIVESYDWKIERLRMPDGRWGVVCHFYDLSERQRYEAALLEGEERFRNMADNAPVMVWVTEPDGACSFLSRSWYEFTGQTPENGLAFGWLEATHPDDRASAEHVFRTANANRDGFRIEYRLRRHDGEYRWVMDSAMPRRGPDDRFLGYIGSVIDITERKHTEQALAADEEKYRHIFEGAGVSLFEEDWSSIRRWFDDLRAGGITDLNTYLDAHPEKVITALSLIRITDVNEYAIRLFQAPSKAALLGALDRIFTPETTAVFREELIAVWEGRDLHERPAPLRMVNGEPLSVLFTLKAPRHAGDWRRVLVAVTDVTGLREAESAVRESEERFRTLADNISQFAWMSDAKGWIFWYNKRWFDYTGTTWEQMQGWGWKAVHHPDHVDHVVHTWQAALEAGEAWEDTFPLRARDGTYRWFLTRALPIRDADGRIVRWFGTNTDITDLREAEQAQAHLAAIVTSSDDAIISTDLSGIITSWNRGADRLYGYTALESVGRSVAILIPAERIDEEPEILTRIRKGVSIEHYETIRRRKDGTLLDVSLTVSPIKDDEGRIIGASKVARDISERKRQEEELRRLKEELEVRVEERTAELLATQGRLMTVTSQLSLTEQRERRKLARDLHDYLAQMLVVGQMKTRLLKKQLPHNPASATLLQDLEKVCQQALVYTRTLIAELSPPSLEESGLSAALKWLGERFEKDGLRVDVRADGQAVPLAEEQAVVVFQAVRELLFNVMKHAGVDQATVTMALGHDDILRVAVADRGKGSTPEALQRAAQPGHLGLVSVRERFRAMGGRVDVESMPGQGTTVTLCLPLARSPLRSGQATAERDQRRDAALMEHSPRAAHLSPVQPIRVLLVDDHKLVRQGLRDILASDDRIRVVGEAGTCDEALLLAANVSPDVVITDINLPGLNGIEMTKRFKKLHPQMTVIGLSAHTEEQMKQDLLSAGAEALLSKENAADELIPMIIQCHDRQVAGR